MEDYVTTYGNLLRKTVRGAKIRALFCGIGSETVSTYLDAQKREIYHLEEAAYSAGQKIQTRANLTLGANLLEVSTNAMFAGLFARC